jgi:plasmid stabilization system protein ParE
VARVLVTRRAQQDLREAITTLGLPADTPARVARRLRPPETFPRLGPELPGGRGLRYLLGPWPWMIVVYRHAADADVVWILSVQDARSSTSPLT